MKRTIFHFAILLFAPLFSFGQNEFNSRLFYVKPPLFDSKSKVSGLHLSKYEVTVAEPADHRMTFYGEEVYKNVKVHAMEEFFKSPTVNEIQKKIEADMKHFGVGNGRPLPHHRINIESVVEVFYPKVAGFLHGKSFAKVRLGLIAKLNDSLMINNTYESFYITDGTDNGFEGSLDMTVEDGTNVTVGMALRETLDQFYGDLTDALAPGKKKLVISGKIKNAKNGEGLSATILFNADSSFTTTSSSDGRYKLVIPFSKHYAIQVSAFDFVNFSDRFDSPSTFLRRTEKNFALQPIEIGTVINLKSVLFSIGTTNLLEESYPELDGVVTFLKSYPKIKIELHGHTDNRGDADKDLILSQQRVDRIKSYLVSKGISGRRIQGKGFGNTSPIASNNTEDGRKLNRRVEFVILKN